MVSNVGFHVFLVIKVTRLSWTKTVTYAASYFDFKLPTAYNLKPLYSLVVGRIKDIIIRGGEVYSNLHVMLGLRSPDCTHYPVPYRTYSPSRLKTS
jgi:hypothetical protein